MTAKVYFSNGLGTSAMGEAVASTAASSSCVRQEITFENLKRSEIRPGYGLITKAVNFKLPGEEEELSVRMRNTASAFEAACCFGYVRLNQPIAFGSAKPCTRTLDEQQTVKSWELATATAMHPVIVVGVHVVLHVWQLYYERSLDEFEGVLSPRHAVASQSRRSESCAQADPTVACAPTHNNATTVFYCALALQGVGLSAQPFEIRWQDVLISVSAVRSLFLHVPQGTVACLDFVSSGV
eukprot:18470-Heterococcus_DN1.PRE.1